MSLSLDTEALSIAQLYDQIAGALSVAFPRSRRVWVRGEIQSLSDQTGRSGHCYLDLIDPENSGQRGAPALKVKCWRTTWGPLRATLAEQGVTLEPGTVVSMRGSIDFYRPKAEIGFVLAELDVTALLGRLAAQRAALIKALQAEGLLEKNRAMAVPSVPLRIGLVGSPGTEGYQDFLGQLTSSGFSFKVDVVPVRVQGAVAPRAVANAIRQLSANDLVVVVRGGGSKADLAAFDSEAVARAIAGAPCPIWTGIGHTGDESVADLVANRSFITPTECGHQLALTVAEWWASRVADPSQVVGRRATEVLAEESHRDALVRGRLASTARHQLRLHRQQLSASASVLARNGPVALEASHTHLATRAARLAPLSLAHVSRASDRLDSWRRLMAAYDVTRQLERGYTLTLDAGGRALRSVVGLNVGADIVTRFADGTTRSTLTELQMEEGA